MAVRRIERLGLVGAVRDRQPVAHERGHRRLALVHRVDVGRLDRAGVDQQPPGLGDRLVAGRAVPLSTIDSSRQHVGVDAFVGSLFAPASATSPLVWRTSSTISS